MQDCVNGRIRKAKISVAGERVNHNGKSETDCYRKQVQRRLL